MDRIPLRTSLFKMTAPPLTTQELPQTLAPKDLATQRLVVQTPEDLQKVGMRELGRTRTETFLELARVIVTSMTIVPLSPVTRRMPVVGPQTAKS